MENRFCPSCGGILPEGAAFCGNCGKPVSATPPAAEAPTPAEPTMQQPDSAQTAAVDTPQPVTPEQPAAEQPATPEQPAASAEPTGFAPQQPMAAPQNQGEPQAGYSAPQNYGTQQPPQTGYGNQTGYGGQQPPQPGYGMPQGQPQQFGGQPPYAPQPAQPQGQPSVPYGQPQPQGQAPYGYVTPQPPQAPKKKMKPLTLVLIILGSLIVLAGIVFAGIKLFGGGSAGGGNVVQSMLDMDPTWTRNDVKKAYGEPDKVSTGDYDYITYTDVDFFGEEGSMNVWFDDDNVVDFITWKVDIDEDDVDAYVEKVVSYMDGKYGKNEEDTTSSYYVTYEWDHPHVKYAHLAFDVDYEPYDGEIGIALWNFM